MMLSATKARLDALYAVQPQPGLDGQLHELNPVVRVSRQQGEAMADAHRELRPDLSIEVGLAYGFSTLWLLDAMAAGGYGRHIAIDPMQVSHWHGIGLRAVRSSGLAGRWPFRRFRWIEERSDFALTSLARQGRRAQYAYIDGSHLFDYALSDFCLTDQLLDVGGMVLLDDLWMPSVQRVVAFIVTNMAWHERVDLGCDNLGCFRKIGHDERDWTHFEDF